MTLAEIEKSIAQYVHDNFVAGLCSGEYSSDDNLVDLGVMDSFGMVEIVGYLEKTYQIRLTDDDLTSTELMSINGMAQIVKRLQS